MSHYQGSSYKSGSDLYRPNSREMHDGSGTGYGQGRSGDRGSGMRPHSGGRPPHQGPGNRSSGPNDRRFQQSQSNYTPPVGNTYNSGYQKQRLPHRDLGPHTNMGGASFGNLNMQGYGSHNSHRHAPNAGFNNTNYGRQSYGANANHQNGNGSSFQNAPSRFPQKRSTDGYHQAYLQTQAVNQLWMGDLDPMWTENDIMGIWREVGEAPVNVKIMRDKQGKPQYSFVTFASPEAVAASLEKNRSQIPGSSRHFKLNWASGGSQADTRPPVNRMRNSPDIGRGHSDYSLFVGDLGMEVTEPELFAKFNQSFPGEVKQAKIMIDPSSGASKGFGFIRFLSVEAQQRALQSMNGIIIGQRPIRLGLANGGSSEAASSVSKKADDLLAAVHISQAQPALTPFTDPNNTTIAVKGIISSITRDELIAHFLPFGHLIYCKVDYTCQIAHVKYFLRASAEKALLFLHGFVVNGARLILRWGREKASTEGITKFPPTSKGGPYTPADRPPKIYRTLPSNIVFENLDWEEVKALHFSADPSYKTVNDLNEADMRQTQLRSDYLNNAF